MTAVPASATIRQRLKSLLLEGSWTAHELADELAVRERDVIAHLEHLMRSQRGSARVEVQPARCAACGFVFRKRNRLDRPSRCPRCKHERVMSARFSMPRGGE